MNFFTDENRLTLEIQDDGIGFDVPESWINLVRDRHYRLADATERAEAIGGELEVVSKPRDGTLVRVNVETEAAE